MGEWLPEPLVTSDKDDPARKAIATWLSLAFLVLLESLSPERRAAFLLRDVFDEPYDRIAEIIGTSEQNARQLIARGLAGTWTSGARFEASASNKSSLRPARGG